MRKKTITILVLAIAIVVLSIGFAAFSSNLSISSGAKVSPTNNFSVKFASQASTSDQGLIYQDNTDNFPVSKNATGLSSADNAIIDNTQEFPIISNLSAHFTQPGETVVYTFYVVNEGVYDAYLTNLVFNNIQGNELFKNCESNISSSNPASNASSVCSGINLSVKLGHENPVQETTTFNNHLLEKGTYEEVIVTISYTGSVYADGSLDVSFGNIELHYRTIDEPVVISTSDISSADTCTVVNHKSFGNSCTYTDLDSSEGISTGDYVTCGTENFYVIKDPSEGKVTMLSEWNLNISEPGDINGFEGVPYSYTYCESTEGYQDNHIRGYLGERPIESDLPYLYLITVEMGGETITAPWPYGVFKFDSITVGEDYGYWMNNSYNSLNNNFTQCSGTICYTVDDIQYPVEVYGHSNSNTGRTATFTSHVTNYVSALNNSINGANAQGRLIKFEELIALGCSSYYNTCSGSSSTAPVWVYQTSYWTGSASDSNSVFKILYDGRFSGTGFDGGDVVELGVRPVIEISSSVVQAS